MRPRLFGEALVELLRLIEHRFDAHRERLGLSADNYGKLLGASGLSIYNWEQGKTRPRKSSVDAWTAIRRIGKREAARRLASLKTAEPRSESKQTPAEK